MGDVILFTVGGAARHILGGASESTGLPIVILDGTSRSNIPMVGDNVRFDTFEAYTIAYDNRDEIRAAMRGMRVVMIFSMLGGSSGTGMTPLVAECAHQEGCQVVTVAGLPMVEEVDGLRRRRALDALPELLGVSDRMIILDMAVTPRIYPELKADSALRRFASSLAFAARSMAWLMEGPFFSTFYRQVYTVAYTTDMDPSSAVARARDASMFDTDPSFGKSVVMVSSGFGTAQIESIYSTVVSMTGIVPDIVKREDGEDTRVLVFLPVQLRSFLSQGLPYLMILAASPKTPMMVLYSYLVGTALPIMRLNMTVVISLRFGGYSIPSIRSPKNSNISSFSALSAGSGLRGTFPAWKNSYMTMVAAWDRFRMGYSSPVGTVMRTSHMFSSSWSSPMSSLPNRTAIFSG